MIRCIKMEVLLSYRVGKIVCARLGLWSNRTESGLT